MDMIDRYLQAVKSALPKSQRDDIGSELSDNILSQVEEREAGLGRPLTEDEVAGILRKLGSPAALASRYREQQGLIGPTVLPIYWKVLKVALGLSFLVQVIAAISTAAAGRPLLVSLQPIFRYPNVALTVFAWVTITFAALHFFGAKFQCSQQWDPYKLPPLTKVEHKKGRLELIATLVVTCIATVWWLVGLRRPFLVFGPGVLFLTFGPVWLHLYPLFVFMGIADISRHCLALAKPEAARLNRIAGLAIRCLGLVVLFFLIHAKDVFVASEPGNPQLQQMVGSVNYALHFGLMIAAVISGVKLLADMWKVMTHRPEPAQSAVVGS